MSNQFRMCFDFGKQAREILVTKFWLSQFPSRDGVASENVFRLTQAESPLIRSLQVGIFLRLLA